MNQMNAQNEPIRILVVDDAHIVLSFYQKGLSRVGYKVDVVDNAMAALEKIQKNDYDIVISDINMDLMNGLELLDVVKRDFPHIEVIMMTGFATVENAIEAMKKGAYDFLLKPVKLDQVRMVVGNCVEKIKMSQEVQKLREVNERLREIKAMKDRFIAITSHELRTPVSHIKSYLEFLEDPDFPEDEKKVFLDIIKKSVSDLERIVTDMFVLSKVEKRELTLHREQHAIPSLMDECLQQLQLDLRNRELTIRHQKRDSFPELYVDAYQIKKVFMELLNNAIRFTPDGGEITISYELSKNTAVVKIKDNGIGIPEEKLGTIFEKFYEIQNPNHHSSSRIDFMGGSTGIGLPLSKGIVEAHGGRLKIDSKVNKGTEVQIYLKTNVPKEEKLFLDSTAS